MPCKTARLEEVAQVLGGGTPSRNEESYFGGGIAWATPTDITALNSLYISKTKETITDAGLQNSSTKLMPPGAVLLTSRATIGFTAVAEVPICTNQGFVNFICGPELVPEYLAYWLRTQRAKMIQHAGGTTFKEIGRGALKKFEIPVPAIPEQHRIVDLLSRAEGIVRLRREAEKKASELIPALFLDMFGDPATNPRGFEHVSLGELLKVKSGEFLPAEKMDQSGDIPVYGGNGINGRHTVAMFDEPQIVIGRVGAYCGNVHLTKEHSWITDNALYVASRSRPVSNHFLVYALRASHLNQYASQAGQPLISAGRIYPVKVQLPSLDLQQQFDLRCQEILALCLQQSAATAKAQATFDALLARVFS